MELKETEKRLLEAVSKIIEEEGFTQIGINRIAKKAQCDKVLIYRYFGGLDGLLAAWAKQYDFYSTSIMHLLKKQLRWSWIILSKNGVLNIHMRYAHGEIIGKN